MPTKTLKLPSQKQLREDFTYNAGTGDFARYDGNSGFLHKGYWTIKYEGQGYPTHRLIWKWWYGYDPEFIDHINGDRTDNRIDNLRNADFTINARNRLKNKNNTSGFNGVYWHKQSNMWRATIRVEKIIHIGTYSTPQEAKEARDEFIKEFYPERFTERHGK